MKERYHIIAELTLIVASIFIFRSVWLLLDLYLNTDFLLPLLIFGILLSIPPLFFLNRHLKNDKET